MKSIGIFCTGVMMAVAMAWPCAAQPKTAAEGVSGVAKVEGSDKTGKGDRSAMRGKMNQELGLTPEQQEKMKKFHEENRARMEALREKMKTGRTALREALDADVLDKGKVAQLSAELNKIFAEMSEMRVQMALVARETLTPEQFKKMKVLRGQHHKKMGAGRGEWKEKHSGSSGSAKGGEEPPAMSPDEDGPGL